MSIGVYLVYIDWTSLPYIDRIDADRHRVDTDSNKAFPDGWVNVKRLMSQVSTVRPQHVRRVRRRWSLPASTSRSSASPAEPAYLIYCAGLDARAHVVLSMAIQWFIRILEYLRYIARRLGFAPSSPWRKPQMTTPHEDRLALVQSAIDVSLQEDNLSPNGQFDRNPGWENWGYAGWLYGQMAELDGASNTNTNETKYRYPDMLAAYFAKAERLPMRAEFASE
ncbi:hypothetical protein B0H16DRAFT_840686 [Mycena metata]|uniref:Uncharacterized protein n=1 Tax=Mycena metata TaxID=1033252 RepID=A0AAD7IVF0_9AGAR|nr:hypothetical protein B0H16DRAFT_840686 [Mycena metata]